MEIAALPSIRSGLLFLENNGKVAMEVNLAQVAVADTSVVEEVAPNQASEVEAVEAPATSMPRKFGRKLSYLATDSCLVAWSTTLLLHAALANGIKLVAL